MLHRTYCPSICLALRVTLDTFLDVLPVYAGLASLPADALECIVLNVGNHSLDVAPNMLGRQPLHAQAVLSVAGVDRELKERRFKDPRNCGCIRSFPQAVHSMHRL